MFISRLQSALQPRYIDTFTMVTTRSSQANQSVSQNSTDKENLSPNGSAHPPSSPEVPVSDWEATPVPTPPPLTQSSVPNVNSQPRGGRRGRGGRGGRRGKGRGGSRTNRV